MNEEIDESVRQYVHSPLSFQIKEFYLFLKPHFEQILGPPVGHLFTHALTFPDDQAFDFNDEILRTY